jgi:hypothetical protein
MLISAGGMALYMPRRRAGKVAVQCLHTRDEPARDRNLLLGDTSGMAWSIERLKDEWLGDAVVQYSPAELVRLFDLVEVTFGEAWMRASRGTSGVMGPHPTLHIAVTGQLIEAATDLPGGSDLLARLQANEPGSRVELLVIAIVRAINPNLNLTLAPNVVVGTKTRKPDLRLTNNDDHVYVEVSAAQSSEETQEVRDRVQEILQRAFDATPCGNTSELYLHREPSDDEVSELVSTIGDLCSSGDEQVLHSELANVVVNSCEPANVVPYNHGSTPRPRLFSIRLDLNPDENRRHAIVLYPYSDERAAKFLSNKSQQLPKDTPGIIILHVSEAVGGMRAWEPLVRQRLRPNLHTRVGAVVLIESGMISTEHGWAWAHQAAVIVNEHANIPVPAWALTPFDSLTHGDWYMLSDFAN